MPLTATISPTQSDAQAALRSFLLDVLPSGTEVILAQANRVPEPQGTSFVVMTPIRFQRLDTNLDLSTDVKFTGSLLGTVLTVSAVAHGKIVSGTFLFGVNVQTATVIQQQLSGTPGGVGTYQISISQTLASQTLSSGYRQFTEPARLVVQLDFHSADTTSGDMAQTVSDILRSEYGTEFITGINAAIAPLHADDPAQRPFINDQQQYEWRWVLEAHLQVNQTVSVGQQFADAVDVGRVPVDIIYPP